MGTGLERNYAERALQGLGASACDCACAVHRAVEDLLNRRDLDLVAEARAELPQHVVVRFVRDAAERILGEDHPVAGVDSVHDSREDAHVGLTTRDDQRIGAKPPENSEKRVPRCLGWIETSSRGQPHVELAGEQVDDCFEVAS
jgi:hypothetical protein